MYKLNETQKNILNASHNNNLYITQVNIHIDDVIDLERFAGACEKTYRLNKYLNCFLTKKRSKQPI